QFNHVMAMVPLENDTLWLENTADYRIAGDLSYNDEGCNVLIVFDDGYKFIKTPESKYSDNKWITKFNGTLNAHGFLNFNGEMILSGNFAHDKRYDFINSKKDELKEWLLKELGRFVPETYVDEFEFLNINENFDKPVVIKFKGIYSKFGNKSGKRVFVNPNIFNRYEPDNIPEETVEERDFPLYTNFAVNVIDSINITFPSYYKVEAVPANADFTYDFAKYNSNYEIKDAQLAYIRSYERYKKIIPVENYAERVKMLKKMVKADKAKVVFKKLK
ncbi:MAG: hypothetical protein KAR38_02100, partial [Calditrichia bacterium]|nr:hypothetical protein [Calditrichia bacterium]